jgi:hypothetical protein
MGVKNYFQKKWEPIGGVAVSVTWFVSPFLHPTGICIRNTHLSSVSLLISSLLPGGIV